MTTMSTVVVARLAANLNKLLREWPGPASSSTPTRPVLNTSVLGDYTYVGSTHVTLDHGGPAKGAAVSSCNL